MKLSVQWLKDYVAIPDSVEELARRLTMAGLEIEGIERLGEGLSGVVVAQIVSSEKHPNADKLSVTQVECGRGAPLQIVCGAKNYKVGDKVPLATVGAELPGGLKISQASMRGVDSHGMLCSAKELGLPEGEAGLLILDPTASVGAPIAEALGLNDVVFEVNVTPNRADALSHWGIAREVAALTGAELKRPAAPLAESTTEAKSRISIRIDDAERCWRYAARVIEGVKVQPSPGWMQARLKACGVRAINNLVDVTNYVMLESGQPLHAFDLDRIGGGKVVVRTASGGEKLKTLDDKVRELHAEDLLICDEMTPLVLAGVMGGASSEVTAATTRVLLECAAFQPATVRRSAKRHALHTESSHRFERGIDVAAMAQVLDRAASLLAQVSGGTVLKGSVDVFPAPRPARQVTLRTARVAEILGAVVSAQECAKVLLGLGFRQLIGDENSAVWEVPSARGDISIEEDLVEEIARIRGFDAIPSALPRGLSVLEPERPAMIGERRLRGALSGCGFDEVVNYSFVAPAELAAFDDGKAIALSNPLSVEQSVMRTTLFASLVPNVLRSVRHQAQGVRFYEWGRTYHAQEQGGENGRPVAKEVLQVGGVLWGLRAGSRGWTGKAENVDFYDARGAVEAVAGALQIPQLRFEPLECAWYHPRAAASVYSGAQLLGTLGELHPRAQKRLDAPSGIFLFQLDVNALVACAQLVPQAQALSRFPSVLRDLAVVVPRDVSAHSVRDVIFAVGQPLVEDVRVFDVYEGAQVGEGKKNLAFALRYRAAEKTLTDAEVNEAHQRIVAQVSERLGGTLRA